MKKQILLPHKCKLIGLGVLIIGIMLCVFQNSIENTKFLSLKFENTNAFTNYLLSGKFSMNFDNGGAVNVGDTSKDFILQSTDDFQMSAVKKGELDFTYTLQILLLIIGGLMIGFSREKIEDEFIATIRLRSLLWSVLINYFLIIIADLLVYGLNFLSVMAYNLYTILLIHIIVFHVLLFKNSRKGAEK